MARLNDDAQWIVLMGFIVSFSFFFLAMILNQSTVVGQTTAEGVLEFPKNDIQDIRHEIMIVSTIPHPSADMDNVRRDISSLAQSRKNAIVTFKVTDAPPGMSFTKVIELHYNNGVTAYNETTTD